MARYTTKLGQRMIVMVLRICRQRSPPPAPQQRHFCSYLRTLSNLATESLPIAPDSIRVAFSQQSNLSYKHMVNSAVGAHGHMGHAMKLPLSCDVGHVPILLQHLHIQMLPPRWSR